MPRFALALLASCGVLAAAEEPKALKADFQDAKVGEVPKGWTAAKTGDGEGSVWKVAEDRTAPKGPKVLAQTAESPKAMFNLCVVEASGFRDVEVSVAYKAVKARRTRAAAWSGGTTTRRTTTPPGSTRWRTTTASTRSWTASARNSPPPKG